MKKEGGIMLTIELFGFTEREAMEVEDYISSFLEKGAGPPCSTKAIFVRHMVKTRHSATWKCSPFVRFWASWPAELVVMSEIQKGSKPLTMHGALLHACVNAPGVSP
ncbi:MAG: hypothetical protein KBC26_01080 [Candidatus Pacebacteria bacterium]|nr:hypothetical protein [Candidatus Paceibacterota bacterium]